MNYYVVIPVVKVISHQQLTQHCSTPQIVRGEGEDPVPLTITKPYNNEQQLSCETSSSSCDVSDLIRVVTEMFGDEIFCPENTKSKPSDWTVSIPSDHNERLSTRTQLTMNTMYVFSPRQHAHQQAVTTINHQNNVATGGAVPAAQPHYAQRGCTVCTARKFQFESDLAAKTEEISTLQAEVKHLKKLVKSFKEVAVQQQRKSATTTSSSSSFHHHHNPNQPHSPFGSRCSSLRSTPLSSPRHSSSFCSPMTPPVSSVVVKGIQKELRVCESAAAEVQSK
eukprot:PhF_6_TR27334/c0_g1_i1/m.40164